MRDRQPFLAASVAKSAKFQPKKAPENPALRISPADV
jgi:hypothetical protein